MKLPVLTPEQKADFWLYVDKGDCWTWTGKVYAAPVFEVYSIAKTTQCNARRLAWFLMYNDDPDGRRVMPICGNPKCINPAHQRCPRQSPSVLRRRRIREAAKLQEKALEARKKARESKKAAEKKRAKKNKLARECYAKKKALKLAERRRVREEVRQTKIDARVEQIKHMIIKERSR